MNIWVTEEDNAELGYISHFDEQRNIWLDISVNVEPRPEYEWRMHSPAGEIYLEDSDKVMREVTPLNWIAA
jgi:hypothetical protein